MAFDPTKDYITREEKYLTKMAGNNDVDVPEPITRFEHYLKAIIDNISSGGGGGGGGGVFVVTVDGDTGALDKTYTEIENASQTMSVVLAEGDEYEMLFSYLSSISVIYDDNDDIEAYQVQFMIGDSSSVYRTHDASKDSALYPYLG